MGYVGICYWAICLNACHLQVSVKVNGICYADVFVQEATQFSRITDPYMLHWLVEKVRNAVANPVLVSTKDVYDGLYTELKVVARVDSGCRGRPKVFSLLLALLLPQRLVCRTVPSTNHLKISILNHLNIFILVELVCAFSGTLGCPADGCIWHPGGEAFSFAFRSRMMSHTP